MALSFFGLAATFEVELKRLLERVFVGEHRTSELREHALTFLVRSPEADRIFRHL